MTNERARSELNQIYGMLSEEKKKALDVAFKAMEQADGEKTCGTCRNEDTYHCAECENKSDYEQAQADGEYIKKSDMIDWLKDIRHRMKPQNYHTASEFEIAENQIWNLIQMLQMGAFPSVAIPSAEPKTGHWIEHPEIETSTPEYLMFYECSECGDKQCFCKSDIHKKHFCNNCGAKMVEPQERSDKE